MVSGTFGSLGIMGRMSAISAPPQEASGGAWALLGFDLRRNRWAQRLKGGGFPGLTGGSGGGSGKDRAVDGSPIQVIRMGRAGDLCGQEGLLDIAFAP
jgi:hypothetical protein